MEPTALGLANMAFTAAKSWLPNRRMDNRAVERLFIALMAVIIGISVFNAVRYAGVL